MNTKITLKYVDAANYKQYIDYVLKGEITDKQLNEIVEYLDDGECIIAEQIGLPTPALMSFVIRSLRPMDGMSPMR